MWSRDKEDSLIKKVIHLAGTTSRLTGGKGLPTKITNYTVTYLYNDDSKDFIRGWHAISKNALYLPDVFLENTFNNGNWIESNDDEWHRGNEFLLKPTLKMLDDKAKSFSGGGDDYQLMYSQDKHVTIRQSGGKKKKRKKTKKRKKKKGNKTKTMNIML